MDSDLTKAFQKAQYHPESRLSDSILLIIEAQEKRNARINLWIYSTIGTFSLVGLFPVIRLLISDFAQSGFYEYLSLAFSDNRALLYWKEVNLSLTESLPMTSIIFSLALVFIFILSLRFIARNIRVRARLITV
jgi:hypothetical protein